MSSKNPFEIRADMLKLAKEYMDQQIHINVDFAQTLMGEAGKVTDEMRQQLKEASTMYSSDELLDKAREFYQFVCTKSDKE